MTAFARSEKDASSPERYDAAIRAADCVLIAARRLRKQAAALCAEAKELCAAPPPASCSRIADEEPRLRRFLWDVVSGATPAVVYAYRSPGSICETCAAAIAPHELQYSIVTQSGTLRVDSACCQVLRDLAAPAD